MCGPWSLEDNLWKLVLPSHHDGFRDQTQVSGLAASGFTCQTVFHLAHLCISGF